MYAERERFLCLKYCNTKRTDCNSKCNFCKSKHPICNFKCTSNINSYNTKCTCNTKCTYSPLKKQKGAFNFAIHLNIYKAKHKYGHMPRVGIYPYWFIICLISCCNFVSVIKPVSDVSGYGDLYTSEADYEQCFKGKT
jgi:hypothetical protein